MAHKFILDGKNINALNRLVLEVVKKYVKEHGSVKYNELKNIFRDELQGTYGVIKNQQELEDLKRIDKEKRFFMDSKDVIDLIDTKVFVSRGWGDNWIDNKTGQEKEGNKKKFLQFVKEELNYNLSEESDSREKKDFVNNVENTNNLNIKNIILYGAPGVGKTYNYRNIISMIEEGRSQKEIFDTVSKNLHVDLQNETFESIKKDGRVEFVTFHQSYSYEDFIEGFRPSDNRNIELEDGIFKNLCSKALSNSNRSVANEKLVFGDALTILLKDKIENEAIVRIDLKRDNSFFDIYDYDKRTIYYTRQGRERDEKYHTLSIKTLQQMYDNEENNIISGGLKTYYEPLLYELLKIGKEKKIEKVEKQNFYIVIDEINRGNISKIFGELITLIEEDKRDLYEVTLPYSKEKFKVPSNLYIIATMNSTDKSIATIDIALRRRFTFLKMKPKAELIKDENAKKLFNDLNKFIKENLNEDYMLGHSYFMKIQNDEDLEFVKEYKIKPLLEEYFYADEENYKIAIAILNKENQND